MSIPGYDKEQQDYLDHLYSEATGATLDDIATLAEWSDSDER